MNYNQALVRTVLITLALLCGKTASAYYETAESGEIQKKGTYRAAVMPQIRLSNGSGMNLSGFLDTALSESTSLRIHLGGGETDFYTGGSFKWIPIPDYNQQPAIGAKAEVIYARKTADSAVSIRLHPLISKKYKLEHGDFVPYVSLPFGTYTYQSNTEMPVNLVAGSEFISPEVENMQFGLEVGLNASKSFSYISAFATLLLDENGNKKTGK